MFMSKFFAPLLKVKSAPFGADELYQLTISTHG